MTDRPLAAAAGRLKGKPGRPRSGHVSGTSSEGDRASGGSPGGALAVRACEPRLLDLEATALYLGVSDWTVRDLEAAGVLPRVRIPTQNNGELRKLLFDREDLDRLIEAWKERVTLGWGPTRWGCGLAKFGERPIAVRSHCHKHRTKPMNPNQAKEVGALESHSALESLENCIKGSTSVIAALQSAIAVAREELARLQGQIQQARVELKNLEDRIHQRKEELAR